MGSGSLDNVHIVIPVVVGSSPIDHPIFLWFIFVHSRNTRNTSPHPKRVVDMTKFVELKLNTNTI